MKIWYGMKIRYGMKIWYNNENMVKLPKYDIHKSGGSDLDSILSVETIKCPPLFSEQTCSMEVS